MGDFLKSDAIWSVMTVILAFIITIFVVMVLTLATHGVIASFGIVEDNFDGKLIVVQAWGVVGLVYLIKLFRDGKII